ncbi:MAG: 3-oxoacyl-ACP synthase III family protein [Betaproteobacteria bacterium]
MPSAITGSGSAIAPNLVTNDMLARIMDTSDQWIRERTGVETRYFVDPGTSTTDLGALEAAEALAAAALAPSDVDMVVFATMTPDRYFPGCGGLLQTRLGLRTVPCFDIRQQCSGFLYGLQLADAQIRAGAARTVLLVGSEVHSGFMPWSPSCWARLYGDADAAISDEEWAINTKTRHLSVLFGDAAAAVVVQQSDAPGRGVVDSLLGADGSAADKLCVPGVGFARRPYVDHAQIDAIEYVPVMDGHAVFKMATARMAEAARQVLARNGLAPSDLKMVLMHQANRRINELVQRMLDLPDEKVLHNIQKYANTTSATIPLLWDECVRTGRLAPGDLVLLVGFGAGMTWGASIVRA